MYTIPYYIIKIIPVKFPCPYDVHSSGPPQLRRPLGIIRWIGRPRLVGLGRWGKVEKTWEKMGYGPRVVYFNGGKIWKKMENMGNMWKHMEKDGIHVENIIGTCGKNHMGKDGIFIPKVVFFSMVIRWDFSWKKYDLMGIRWNILGK